MSLQDLDDQKEWFNKLKSKFTTADALYLAGTAAIAALNPKGVSAQAKIIEDDLKLSKSMGANLVTNAQRVIDSDTIPKMNAIEEEKEELLEFISADLQGASENPVENPFIAALINAGPAYWRAFRKKLDAHNKWRAKTYSSGGGGLKPLTGSEIQNAFSDGASILEKYGDLGMGEENRYSLDQWSSYIDDKYKKWEDYIDNTGADNEREAGLFAALHSPTLGAMSERDRILSMLPGRNVAGDYIPLEDLYAISQSATEWGITDDIVPIEGGYTFMRSATDPFSRNVSRKLEDPAFGFLQSVSETSGNANKAFTVPGTAVTVSNLPRDWDGVGALSMLKGGSNFIHNLDDDNARVPWNGSIDSLVEQLKVMDEEGLQAHNYYRVVQTALNQANSNPLFPIIVSQVYAQDITARNSTKIRNNSGANELDNIVASGIVAWTGSPIAQEKQIKQLWESVRRRMIEAGQGFKDDNSDEKSSSVSNLFSSIELSKNKPFMSEETLSIFLKAMGVRATAKVGDTPEDWNWSYGSLQASDVFRFYGKEDSNGTMTLYEMPITKFVQSVSGRF